MLTRSVLFDDTMRAGGTVVSKIDAYRQGSLVLADIPWLSGSSITVDSTASSWRTLDLRVPDDGTGIYLPTDASHPLEPYDTELQVQTGFRYTDGSEELLPVGRFRIIVSEPSRGMVPISGVDRSIVVSEGRFQRPLVISGNPLVGEAVGGIIDTRYPGLDYSGFVSFPDRVPLTVYGEGDTSGDPWRNCMDLAAGAGGEVFFGPSGEPILRPIPDPYALFPGWVYEAGSGSLLPGLRNRMESTGARNIFIAMGEGSEVATPLRGEARITDATSPIYPGTFGERPSFLVSSLITTQAQADAAAQGNLLKRAGGTEQLSWDAIPHPASEAGDCVLVVDPALGVNVRVILTSFKLDLGLLTASPMVSRARRAA